MKRFVEGGGRSSNVEAIDVVERFENQGQANDYQNTAVMSDENRGDGEEQGLGAHHQLWTPYVQLSSECKILSSDVKA